jgi:hypothetical protein
LGCRCCNWGRGLSHERVTALQAADSLIWTAIDSDPNAHSDLLKRLATRNKSAKELIGDDPECVQLAYQLLEHHSEARRVFQNGFGSLDSARRGHVSRAHGSLAELIHRGIVELTVSLNWDTLLESAYELKYGVTLAHLRELLFKPHGSADRPDLPWVLPHQSGLVPSNLLSRIRELARLRPRVLLVIGYSERDEEVVQSLIGPLEKRWRVVRIGPSAGGASDIPLVAEKALPRLLEAIAPSPELSRWEYVTFNVQRGFADALLGHRLGPQNVEGCPQLPELQSALRSLSLVHRVIIGGTSGSGKSITAYQAAYSFHQKGFEVLQSQRNPPLVEALNELSDLNHPSVIVVDDAHLTPADFRTRQLRVDRSIARASSPSAALEQLLSSHVLAEWQPAPAIDPDRYSLAFTHNLLFDYAGSQLLLPRSPDDLIALLVKDQDLVLVVRPSIVFVCQALWERDRNEFWKLVLSFCAAATFSQMIQSIPLLVVASNAKIIDDVQPLISALESHRPGADCALRHLVGALRSRPKLPLPLAGPTSGPWSELVNEVTKCLTRQTNRTCQGLVELLLQEQDLTWDQRQLVGAAARRILKVALNGF